MSDGFFGHWRSSCNLAVFRGARNRWIPDQLERGLPYFRIQFLIWSGNASDDYPAALLVD
jgi:hypothetical protein